VLESGEPCDDGNTTRWDGCDECTIVEFQVNTWTTGSQTRPDVAMGADGRFVAVWDSWLQDGSGWGVFGQRFDADGALAGPEFQVNTDATDDQMTVSADMAPDGGFVAVWEHEHDDHARSRGLFGQRFDGAGLPAGSEFVVHSPGALFETFAAVGMAADGGFVVVWEAFGSDEPLDGIFGRRFDADGGPIGDEFRIDDPTTGRGSLPSVAVLADGKFVVAWGVVEAADRDAIQARWYQASGGPAGPPFQVNTSTGFRLLWPSVAAAAGGASVVAWESREQDGDDFGVFGQRLDAGGAPVGPEFQANTWTAGMQGVPAPAMATDGRFVVVWQSVGQDGDGWGVFAQRYDAAGAPAGSEFRTHSWTRGNQWLPSVAMAADGRFVVVWASEAQEEDWGDGVFAQRYGPDGRPVGRSPW
jgi:cysteine-rich repeat protein